MPDYKTLDFFLNLFAICLVVLPIYWATTKTALRRFLLIATTGTLLYSIAPRLLVFYIFFWLVVSFICWVNLVSRDKGLSGWLLGLSITLLLLPLVLWRIFEFEFVKQFNLITNHMTGYLGDDIAMVDISRWVVIPLGLSFAAFRAIDLLIQTNLGIESPKFRQIFSYGFFPTIQIVGPISEFREIEPSIARSRADQKELWSPNLVLLTKGLFKVLIVSTLLQPSAAILSNWQGMESWILLANLVLYMFYFYFNFSGFSDIAVSFAGFFGFQISNNFNRPFLQQNPQAFWNSWHMSLTSFMRRNVFVPLGGFRKERELFAVMVTMLAVALWHGLTVPLVLFGLYHGSGIIIWRLWSRSHAPREGLLPRVARTASTFAFVALAMPLMTLKLQDIPSFYSALLGFSS